MFIETANKLGLFTFFLIQKLETDAFFINQIIYKFYVKIDFPRECGNTVHYLQTYQKCKNHNIFHYYCHKALNCGRRRKERWQYHTRFFSIRKQQIFLVMNV